MRSEEDESAPRTDRGAGEVKKRKVRKKTHLHIGPNARAYRAGMAFCPICDADKTLRLTESERESEKAARDRERFSRAASRVGRSS